MNTAEKLRQHKTVKISGVKFVIRKLNPLLDFAPDKMPQIFTDFQSRRPKEENPKYSIEKMRKILEDMGNVIKAGVVKPEIDKDVKLADILSNQYTAYELYSEILIHSLNIFKGIKGVFFSRSLKRYISTLWRSCMENSRLI